MTVQSRTFCCCIPVRAGVIVLSMLGFLIGGFISAIAIMGIKNSTGLKTSLGLQVAAFIVLTLVSLLGLIGGIGRKKILVKVYFGLTVFQLAFGMGAGIYAIYRVFKDSHKYVEECLLPNAADADKIAVTCKQGISLIKGLMVAAFIVAWLIQIGMCVIVHRYVQQLEEEEEVGSMVKDTERDTW